MKRNGFKEYLANPTVYFRVFQDNSGALEMPRIHNFRKSTKHLNIWLQHFWVYVIWGNITINHIDTTEQPANFLTKVFNENILVLHRSTVMGW